VEPTGAGDDEDSLPSAEGCVEGDLFVAAEEDVAGDERGDGALRPLAHGCGAEAGEAEAGAGDIGEGDAGRGSDLGEHGLKARGCFVLRDAHQLDGAVGGAGEDAVVIGQQALGLGATGVDGEEEGHGEQ
jgi:hypothetical protein